MNTLLAGLALLIAANTSPLLAKNDGGKAKKTVSTPAADPNTAASKAHGGKVWILTGAGPNGEGEELSKWLASHPAAAEVTKKPSEERPAK